MVHSWLYIGLCWCSWGFISSGAATKPLLGQSSEAAAENSEATLGSTMSLEELRNGGKPKSMVDGERLKPRLITAAAEPVPVLRYRFWPSEEELKSGDAKVYFFRTAVSFNSASREKQLEEYFTKWEELRESGKELPIHEIRKTLQPYRLQFDELETMSLCDHQNLDLQLRNLRGSDVYAILLEEVQVARSIAKLLRWRMVEQGASGDWDGFARTTRTGYRLARLIASGDTLIHGLVGMSITTMITEEVQSAAQLKDSPNFYWALASLPRPMFNLRPALELETSIVERIFPFLVECRKGPLPESVVQQQWEAMQKIWQELDPEFSATASVVGALSVEKAKANLLQRGWTEERFKAYPVMQLVLIDLDDTLREKGNLAMRYYLLPDQVALSARIKASEALEKWIKEDKSLASLVAGMLFPAITQVSNAMTRTEYIINGAMNKEAIRMHVKEHGELPKNLDALEIVPALPNPYTHKPYDMVVQATSRTNLVEVVIKGEVAGIPAADGTWISPFLIEVKSQK